MRLTRLLAASFALAALAGLAFAPVPAAAALVTRNFTFRANVNEYPQADPSAAGYSACWSYIHGDGREYAILGTVNGTAIYNVTNPSAPYRVALIPGPFSIWREAKSYRNWIYIVTEGSGTNQGLQIVRMTNPEAPLLVQNYTGAGFIRSHTISIDTTRALLVCNGTNDPGAHAFGMRILSIANPEAPVALGWWPGTLPVADADYIHDCVPVGNTLYAASIYSGLAHTFDITDPMNPVLQETWTYPGAFTHNIWPTTDGQTLYLTDETNGEPLKVFDVSNPMNPTQVNAITCNPQAIVHNVHVKGDELYLANYTEGIRALDISDPHHPAEFATADSYSGVSGGFSGVWEVCPYFPSGIVIASDRQTGLYIYEPVRDYGLLRVKVQYADGTPVAGLEVKLTTQGDSLTTPADGIVQFAPSPGAHTVLARSFGFYDASESRLISTGLRDTVVLTMRPRPTVVQFAGIVRSATTQAALQDAEISLNVPELPAVKSFGDGAYVIPSVPANQYHLTVAAPGYMPIESDIDINQAYSGQDFQLVPAPIYDNLESGFGWSAGAAGDNATSGQWVRVEPFGTGEPSLKNLLAANSAIPFEVPECCRGTVACTGQCLVVRTAEAEGAVPGDVNPEFDRTPPPGVMCFVTGQGTVPSGVSEADVDGGKTSLTSPVMNLSGMSQPRIGYWRWFYSNNSIDDWFAVLISNNNGATWVPVDTLYGPATVKWQHRSINVSAYVTPTTQMRVRFVAADQTPNTVVEAAIDDVTGYDAAQAIVEVPATPAAPLALKLGAPRPNPARGGTVAIELALPKAGAIEAGVFDVNGRRVRVLEQGFAAAGTRALRWDGRDDLGGRAPAGMYFVRVHAAGEVAETRVVWMP